MFAFASVGSGRWKAERSRSGPYGATKEVAKRQSRHPTEAGASVPFTTRDICFNEDLPAVLQRRADGIDQSEYVQDFSRIDSGDARRCWRFGWDVGDGSGAIPKRGDRDGGSSGAPEPSSQRKRARLRNV